MVSEINSLPPELQRAMACPFMSDLRSVYISLSAQAGESALVIPLKKYSLSACNAAAANVTGKQCSNKTTQEVRAKIATGE